MSTNKEQQAHTATPGPWDYFVGNANGRGLIRIETSHLAPVAGIHIASMVRGTESEANARLIAAAPDLLAALRWFIDDIDGTHTVMVEFDDNVSRARAAIARATGEAK